mmetsp:Transcript_11543/g.17642  ORF Transcript_11543/g.17642 Transcript_11543/m.17642 type:complete len:522 (+) Transcript_11543:153-1718(+)|eukprot:CAMPEP_0201736028 /NCGR_PEP_ID=MMETSP0593-20130828/38628_1 /ASSEMBLY_ACC=CAM_ASM_000672 /TAXON_ID=267983 /ORGANISM="Skeletonema japonicum, Strain CCMP2506" /LENGTH=521 /DNA_ID=CAMNT_0048229691 /DNA_START=38 /DNA_END=1603 /DNA_ORIENTATION=-
MNRYEITATIGDGSFGRVFRATQKESGTVFAIKQIKKKIQSWTECISLREIQSLRELSHPNIVSLREVMLEGDGSLYLLFEYMSDGSLYELMKRCIEGGHKLTHDRVKSYVLQLLSALSFLHDEKDAFHRDLKPENVLVSGNTVKLADFGLCREITANAPFTYYVSTRWYRSPEVILRSPSYGPPIDLYGAGLILYELYSLTPLLPGSSEIDQIKLMTDLLGPPIHWDEGVELMKRMKLVLPPSASSPRLRRETQEEVELRIQQRLPKDVPSSAANLIALLLSWNPHDRPSAKECMQSSLFSQSINSTSQKDKVEKDVEEEEQAQKAVPSTVKRSNLSNERSRKHERGDTTDTSTRKAARLPFSLKKSEGTHHGEDNNEFNDYLAAVSSSCREDGSLPASSSGRTGHKIRPLLFEKENRTFSDESQSRSSHGYFQEITGFDYAKSTRKKRKPNIRKYRGMSSVTQPCLGRGIQVQISNQTPFVPADNVANIWDKTEENVANIWDKTEETNSEFVENEFHFR